MSATEIIPLLATGSGIGVGLWLRTYLKRNHPNSGIRPTIDRIADVELKRALKWTLNFGMMAGVACGFLIGMFVAQRRLLADCPGNILAIIVFFLLIAFFVLMVLASRPPLGKKWLRASEAPTQASFHVGTADSGDRGEIMK
jgi:hypothetical protein